MISENAGLSIKKISIFMHLLTLTGELNSRQLHFLLERDGVSSYYDPFSFVCNVISYYSDLFPTQPIHNISSKAGHTPDFFFNQPASWTHMYTHDVNKGIPFHCVIVF